MRSSVCAWLVFVLAGVHSAAASGVMLTRSGSTLLLDGEPVRLIAYGDYGLVAESAFEYQTFLDIIADTYGLNFVRVWVNYHWCNDLTPFAGVRPSYNLLAQNDAFYARLRDFVAYADTKGIVVQVCLFDGVAVVGGSGSNRWPYFPYNTDMNIQTYLTHPSHFQTIPSTWWTNVSVPLIDRVVDELGNFGNVIYESVNEPDSHGIDVGTSAFNEAIVDRLYERLHLPQYTGSKVISVNPEIVGGALWNWALASSKVDLLARHVHDPSGAGNYNGLPKPIIISNDGDISQRTGPDFSPNYGGLVQSDRIARTNAFLSQTFDTGAAHGHNHFEFLDKGLNASSWLSNPPNYQPRVAHINTGILEALAAYVVEPPEPPGLPGDLDGNGEVDMNDYALFQQCFSGTGTPYTDPACSTSDLNGDGAVDLTDLQLFIDCMSGTGLPADPDCLNS